MLVTQRYRQGGKGMGTLGGRVIGTLGVKGIRIDFSRFDTGK